MSKQVLIVIDVQNAMTSGEQLPPVYQVDSLTANINSLIAKARSSNIPIVFIKHNSPAGSDSPVAIGTDGNEISHFLNRDNNDQIVEKEFLDSFYKTDLAHILSELNAKKLVICGAQSEFCVDTFCRSAFSKNYKLILIEDAHSTWDNGDLTAKQIISHHNNLINNRFANVVKESDFNFVEE